MVLPVFVLAVFGLFDVGRLVYINSTLSQAAREGARLAATEAGWIGLTGNGCVGDASAIGSGEPGCPRLSAERRRLRGPRRRAPSTAWP